MDQFINMNISELLSLQQKLKEVKEYKKRVKGIDAIELFKNNIELFSKITDDIDKKWEYLNELY